MKIERYTGQEERLVLISLIVDKLVLGRVASRWDGDLFPSPWSNLIASWCISYFHAYNNAPGKVIESIFRTWVNEEAQDENTVNLLEKFLATLSGEYERYLEDSKPDYILTVAGKLFNEARVGKVKSYLEDCIESGHIDKAIERLNKFKRVEIAAEHGIDALRDLSAFQLAFDKKPEAKIMVKYPGDVGHFLNDALSRGKFVAFEGAEGVGKSRWLLDLAVRAARQKRRVAFIDAGDMSQADVLVRLGCRLLYQPSKAQQLRIPKGILVREGIATVKRIVQYDKGLDWPVVQSRISEFLDKNNLDKETYLRLLNFSSGTLTVSMIESLIEEWRHEGWPIDILVLDYADILAPPAGEKDKLEAIHKNWLGLRRISLDTNGLVVTATQVKRSGYKATTIDRDDTADDKRKLAHVTSMFGLIVTEPNEKEEVTTMNAVKMRDSATHRKKVVYCAGCWAVTNPCVRSSF